MLNQSSTARWSTACQTTRSNRRALKNSTSHCSVSPTCTHSQWNCNPCCVCQLYTHLAQTPHLVLSSNQIQQKMCSSNWRIRGQSKRGTMCWWSVRLMETLSQSLNFLRRWETIYAKSQLKDLVVVWPYYSYSCVYLLTQKGSKLQGLKGTLRLKSVTRKDAGVYECDAQDFYASPGVNLVKNLSLFVHCKYQSQTYNKYNKSDELINDTHNCYFVDLSPLTS